MAKLILNKLDFNSIDPLSIPVGATVLGIDTNTDKVSRLDYAGEVTIVEQMGNFYTTGATYSNGFIYFSRNDQENAYTTDLTALLGSINTYTTGFTYDNINELKISDNSGNTFSVSITQFSGLTVNGELITDLVTVTQINTDLIYTDTIVADTFSGGTYYGDGSNLLGVATATNYKFAKLPSNTYTPQFQDSNDTLGYFYQNLFGFIFVNPYPYVFLENGNLGQFDYCMSVLQDGTLIYYVLDRVAQKNGELNFGYLVAMKQNDTNPNLLEKIAEIQMTTSLWDYGWDYTYKVPSEPNSVTFQRSNFGYDELSTFTSYLNKVEVSGNSMSITETIYDFSGLTILDIFINYTGISNPKINNFRNPEYILDDDYYGMAYGPYSGWFYCIPGNLYPNNHSTILALNILTGEDKLIDVLTPLSNVTNFNPQFGFTDDTLGGSLSSHPSGMLFFNMNDGNPVDNYSLSGVTAMWSPDWVNNTEVRYLDVRDPYNGVFTNVNGGINNQINYNPSNWYYDNEYYHQFNSVSSNGNTFLWSRIKLDSQDPTEKLILPINTSDFATQIQTNSTSFNTWYNNDGMLMYINEFTTPNNLFGRYNYFYWKTSEEKPYYLQSNNQYPTNLLNNKSYSTSNYFIYNVISLGFQYDEYTDITF